MTTETKSLMDELVEEKLTNINRIIERVHRSKKAYAEVYQWIKDNVPEQDLISLGFDFYGDPSVSVVLDRVKDGEGFIAQLARENKMKLEYTPEVSASRNFCLVFRDEEAHKAAPILYITVSARLCRMVETGEVEVKKIPVRKLVCD